MTAACLHWDRFNSYLSKNQTILQKSSSSRTCASKRRTYFERRW